jgi:hypothetical protein
MSNWTPNPSIEPRSVRVREGEYHRYYPIPGVGDLVGTTTVLGLWGAGTNALIAWGAGLERRAVLSAAGQVYSEARSYQMNSTAFIEEVEKRLGKERAHVKALDKAADIGTAAHEYIHWWLKSQANLTRDPEPKVPDASLVAVMSFQDWWKQSGLKPVAMEETVWDATLGYAGRIDLVAEDPEGNLVLVDFKTSKYVYDKFHMQVAAYLNAARHNGYFRDGSGIILKLPKSQEDSSFEAVPLGQMYDRTLTEAQLLESFAGLLRAFQHISSRPLPEAVCPYCGVSASEPCLPISHGGKP